MPVHGIEDQIGNLEILRQEDASNQVSFDVQKMKRYVHGHFPSDPEAFGRGFGFQSIIQMLQAFETEGNITPGERKIRTVYNRVKPTVSDIDNLLNPAVDGPNDAFHRTLETRFAGNEPLKLDIVFLKQAYHTIYRMCDSLIQIKRQGQDAREELDSTKSKTWEQNIARGMRSIERNFHRMSGAGKLIAAGSIIFSSIWLFKDSKNERVKTLKSYLLSGLTIFGVGFGLSSVSQLLTGKGFWAHIKEWQKTQIADSDVISREFQTDTAHAAAFEKGIVFMRDHEFAPLLEGYLAARDRTGSSRRRRAPSLRVAGISARRMTAEENYLAMETLVDRFGEDYLKEKYVGKRKYDGTPYSFIDVVTEEMVLHDMIGPYTPSLTDRAWDTASAAGSGIAGAAGAAYEGAAFLAGEAYERLPLLGRRAQQVREIHALIGGDSYFDAPEILDDTRLRIQDLVLPYERLVDATGNLRGYKIAGTDFLSGPTVPADLSVLLTSKAHDILSAPPHSLTTFNIEWDRTEKSWKLKDHLIGAAIPVLGLAESRADVFVDFDDRGIAFFSLVAPSAGDGREILPQLSGLETSSIQLKLEENIRDKHSLFTGLPLTFPNLSADIARVRTLAAGSPATLDAKVDTVPFSLEFTGAGTAIDVKIDAANLNAFRDVKKRSSVQRIETAFGNAAKLGGRIYEADHSFPDDVWEKAVEAKTQELKKTASDKIDAVPLASASFITDLDSVETNDISPLFDNLKAIIENILPFADEDGHFLRDTYNRVTGRVKEADPTQMYDWMHSIEALGYNADYTSELRLFLETLDGFQFVNNQDRQSALSYFLKQTKDISSLGHSWAAQDGQYVQYLRWKLDSYFQSKKNPDGKITSFVESDLLSTVDKTTFDTDVEKNLKEAKVEDIQREMKEWLEKLSKVASVFERKWDLLVDSKKRELESIYTNAKLTSDLTSVVVTHVASFRHPVLDELKVLTENLERRSSTPVTETSFVTDWVIPLETLGPYPPDFKTAFRAFRESLLTKYKTSWALCWDFDLVQYPEIEMKLMEHFRDRAKVIAEKDPSVALTHEEQYYLKYLHNKFEWILHDLPKSSTTSGHPRLTHSEYMIRLGDLSAIHAFVDDADWNTFYTKEKSDVKILLDRDINSRIASVWTYINATYILSPAFSGNLTIKLANDYKTPVMNNYETYTKLENGDVPQYMASENLKHFDTLIETNLKPELDRDSKIPGSGITPI